MPLACRAFIYLTAPDSGRASLKPQNYPGQPRMGLAPHGHLKVTGTVRIRHCDVGREVTIGQARGDVAKIRVGDRARVRNLGLESGFIGAQLTNRPVYL